MTSAGKLPTWLLDIYKLNSDDHATGTKLALEFCFRLSMNQKVVKVAMLADLLMRTTPLRLCCRACGLELPSTLAFDHPTTAALTDFVTAQLAPVAAAPAAAGRPNASYWLAAGEHRSRLRHLALARCA